MALGCVAREVRPRQGLGDPCWRDAECVDELVCRDEACSWPPRRGEASPAAPAVGASERDDADEVAACAHLYALMLAELGDEAPGTEVRDECRAAFAEGRADGRGRSVRQAVDCVLDSKRLEVAAACLVPEPAGAPASERRPSRWLCEAFAAKLVGLTTVEAGADPQYALEHGAAFVDACMKEASFEEVACVLAAETIEDVDTHCP